MGEELMGRESVAETVLNAASPIEHPHTLVLFVLAMLCPAVSISAMGSSWPLGRQRTLYWLGTAGAAVCVVVGSLPNIAMAVTLALLAGLLMVLPAYFNSQYIKIGNRVIAFHDLTALQSGAREPASNGWEDQPYTSTVSAAKLWWLLVVCTAMAAVNVYAYVFDGDDPRYGLLGLALLVGIGALFGAGDGMRLQRIARGQYLQFGIVSVISAGIVSVSYLVARAIAPGVKDPTR
ncbi:MAG: hypothetical protein WBB07_00845 [Mycobacterium sp.]